MDLPLKPSRRIGWWAFGLGIAAFLWGMFGTSVPMMIRQSFPDLRVMVPLGFVTAGVAVALALAAIVTGIRAIRSGDRSILLFVGFVPAVLVGGFWILFALGEVLLPH